MSFALWCSLLALAGPPGAERTLADHRFGLPVAIDPAFTTPFLSFRQGFGWRFVPDYAYPGIPEPLPMQLGGLTETLQGQIGLGSVGALYLQGTGGLLSGLDPGSAFFVGAQGTYELRAGWRALVLRRGRAQVTARAGVRQSLGVGLVPADLVVSVLDDPQAGLPALLSGQFADQLLATERATQVVIGGATAVALSPFVGLQASMSARVGASRLQTREIEVRGPAAQIGAGASIDLRPGDRSLGVQIGLRDRLERELSTADALPERNRLLLTSQVYYDRTDLMLGLVVSGATRSGEISREWELGLEGRAVAFF